MKFFNCLSILVYSNTFSGLFYKHNAMKTATINTDYENVHLAGKIHVQVNILLNLFLQVSHTAFKLNGTIFAFNLQILPSF